ncbi:MAG: CPBP family intramembrane metalloprotease [Acidimicrobiia bacterium]|nr:CPBP family intramembrane metalloprotease [Acidimicrobiia bacterium]
MSPRHRLGRWIQAHPLVGSVLITVLAGVFLSMTHIIGFRELIGDPDDVPVRLIDVGFRMTMGALLVLLVVPLLLGDAPRPGWLRRYLAHMRVSMGPSPGKTATVAVLSVVVLLVMLMVGAVALGEFDPDVGVLVAGDQWVILLLSLVPGIWEELTFRGVILSNLQPGFPPIKAVIASSLLFGLYHFSNLMAWDDPIEVVFGVILATIFGLGWGYAVIMANSILPGVYLHYMFNSLLAAPLFFAPGTTDVLAGPLFLALILGFPTATVLITRLVFGRRNTVSPALLTPVGPTDSAPDASMTRSDPE